MKPILYSMKGCPYCEEAKEALDKYGIDYYLEEVNDREARQELYRQWEHLLELADPIDRKTFPKMLISSVDKPVLLPNAVEIILYAKAGAHS